MRQSLMAWVCVMVVVGWGGWVGVTPALGQSSWSGPGTFTVWEADRPDLPPGMYRVTANVLAESTDGTPRNIDLQLWNEIEGQRYFSKAPPVPTQGKGNSSTVSLEFQPGDKKPTRLELEARLPEGVTLQVRNVRLEPLGMIGGVPNQWWSVREGAMVGAVLGSGVGVVGAVVGVLAARGKGRRLVMGLIAGVMGMGVVCLVAGIVAVVMKQPYHVYYPLLLVGVLGTVIMGVVLPRVRGGYQMEEQRRMQAVDL